jgi:hypothetical protein
MVITERTRSREGSITSGAEQFQHETSYVTERGTNLIDEYRINVPPVPSITP